MSLPESALSSNHPDAAPPVRAHGNVWGRFTAVLFIMLCVEIGTFLLVLPWSAVWDRSLFLRYYPLLRPFYMSTYVRGAISGVGLVNIWLGVSYAWHFRRPASGWSA